MNTIYPTMLSNNHLSGENLESKKHTLADLIQSSAGNELTLNAQLTNNLGNTTLLFILPMKSFYNQSVVANQSSNPTEKVAQRPLNAPHAKALAKYMIKALIMQAQKIRVQEGKKENITLNKILDKIGKQVYTSLQPIVCNIRTIKEDCSNVRAERILSQSGNEAVGCKIWLSQKHLLHVVDGQHRREAMKILFDFLHEVISTKKLVKKNNLLDPFEAENEEKLILAIQEISHVAHTYATVQIECHIGLDINKERQLFYDLNHLGKKIEQSLVLNYDQANPINTFISEYLMNDNSNLNCNVTDTVTKFEDCDGSMTRRELITINAKLMFNKATAYNLVKAQVNGREELAIEFWQAVSTSRFFGEDKARHKTLIAQAPFLRTLAGLMYKFAYGKDKVEAKKNNLLDFIVNYDFSPNNKVWICTLLTADERYSYNVNDIYCKLAEKYTINPGKYYEQNGSNGIVQIKNITSSVSYLSAIIEAILAKEDLV